MPATYRITIDIGCDQKLNTGDKRMNKVTLDAVKSAEAVLDGKVKRFRWESWTDDEMDELREKVKLLQGAPRCVSCQHRISGHQYAGDNLASAFGNTPHACVDQFGWRHFAGMPTP